jgi:hypothetical protein
MTVSNISAICDLEAVTREYEELRSNALGNINQAVGVAFFLRNGMSIWLREFTMRGFARPKMHHTILSAFARTEAEMPKIGIASILADAILNIAGENKQYRGHP